MIMTRLWYCFQFFHVTPLNIHQKTNLSSFLEWDFSKNINTVKRICEVWFPPVCWSATSMSSQMMSGLNGKRCGMWMTIGIMDCLLVTREDQGIWPPLCQRIWCRSGNKQTAPFPLTGETIFPVNCSGAGLPWGGESGVDKGFPDTHASCPEIRCSLPGRRHLR